MSDLNQKKQVPAKKGNTFVATMTGAVMGAGIALAGVVALKNKKNRATVNASLVKVKKKIKTYLDDAQKLVVRKGEEAKAGIKKQNEKTKKTLGVKKEKV